MRSYFLFLLSIKTQLPTHYNERTSESSYSNLDPMKVNMQELQLMKKDITTRKYKNCNGRCRFNFAKQSISDKIFGQGSRFMTELRLSLLKFGSKMSRQNSDHFVAKFCEKIKFHQKLQPKKLRRSFRYKSVAKFFM